MKKFLFLCLLIITSQISYADESEEEFKFLRCVNTSNNDSENIKYFEVSVPQQFMIEQNGYNFTFIRLTPFLIQAELKGLAKLSLHRHLGTLAYSNLNADGSSDQQVYQCYSVPRLI